MDDELQDTSPAAPAFERPHRNGAAEPPEPPPRKHAPWEFLILALLVAILCIGIILGWTLVGSHSPERLDDASAAALSTACTKAQTAMKALPNPNPVQGADRVARVRAENAVFDTMLRQFATVHPTGTTPAAAVKGWTADWARMVTARARYADDLQNVAGTDTKVRLIYPATNAIKPVTGHMDDFVRENTPRLDACFTEALQLEVVEFGREYKKVTK